MMNDLRLPKGSTGASPKETHAERHRRLVRHGWDRSLAVDCCTEQAEAARAAGLPDIAALFERLRDRLVPDVPSSWEVYCSDGGESHRVIPTSDRPIADLLADPDFAGCAYEPFVGADKVRCPRCSYKLDWRP